MLLFLALGVVGIGAGQLLGGRLGQICSIAGTVLGGVALVLVLVGS